MEANTPQIIALDTETTKRTTSRIGAIGKTTEMPEGIKLIEIEITCPNCGIITKAGYNEEKRPSVFGKCSFCNALWRWRKSSVVEIPDRNKTQYIIIIEDNE